MDTAKAQRKSEKPGGTTGSPFAWLWARAGSLRLQLRGLQFKLIVPYLVLTFILATSGVFIVTALVVNSERERFHNNMLDASRVANDGFVSYERNQLERLRFLIFSKGMAQAMYEKNGDQIYTLMRPILVNSAINVMTAVDLNGKEIVSFGKDPTGKEYHLQKGVNFSSVTVVQKILDGSEDEKGDKFSEVLRLEQGPILFTAAPVRDANQQMVGVMLVGTYLEDILIDLKKQSLADIILLDNDRKLVDTTLNGREEGFLQLIGVALNLNDSQQTEPKDIKLNQRPFKVAYSPFIIREVQVGWIGVIKSGEYLVNSALTTRNLFAVLFTFGTLAVIMIGYFLAQNIARPILRLRSMSQAVAGGNLNQHIGLRRSDEIGELAESFDTMTLHLRERTEEAERLQVETERLYAEELQRNKELAEINAKLEATQLQLIQSEKLSSIGQLTAGIVHDVKNPFAVIMGMAEVLADDDKMDEATRHGLKVIRESAIKGNTIVSDLLKFARQSKSEMRCMDLRETVQSSMRLTAYLTRKYNTIAEIPETPLMVNYDAQQVEQVLINMIHNAVQAMPNRGMLRVSLKQMDGSARVAIQDTGSGIAPDHLKRIFDPFFTTKPEGEGTGLGLSVSYGIIANHRGRIEVESEIGQGTTFTIVLPVTQPSSETGENNS